MNETSVYGLEYLNLIVPRWMQVHPVPLQPNRNRISNQQNDNQFLQHGWTIKLDWTWIIALDSRATPSQLKMTILSASLFITSNYLLISMIHGQLLPVIDHRVIAMSFQLVFPVCIFFLGGRSGCSIGPPSPRRLPGLLVSGQHRLQHDHGLHWRKPVFMRAFPHFLALLGRRRQIRPHRWRSPTPRR